MSKMSRLDYEIQRIKEWFIDHLAYIYMAIIVIFIAVLVHAQADRDKKAQQEKQNRINTIEEWQI